MRTSHQIPVITTINPPFTLFYIVMRNSLLELLIPIVCSAPLRDAPDLLISWTFSTSRMLMLLSSYFTKMWGSLASGLQRHRNRFDHTPYNDRIIPQLENL